MNLLILVSLAGMLFCIAQASVPLSQTNSLNKQGLTLQRRDGHHKKKHKHHKGGHHKHHHRKVKRDKVVYDHPQIHGRHEKREYAQTLQYIKAAVDSYKKEKEMNKDSNFLNSVSYSSKPENSLLDRLAAVAPSSPSYSIKPMTQQDQTSLSSPAYSVAKKVVEAKLSPNKKSMPVYNTMPNFFMPAQLQPQQQRVQQQQQQQRVQPQQLKQKQLQNQQVKQQNVQLQQMQPQQTQKVQQVQQASPVLSKESLAVNTSTPSPSVSAGMSTMVSDPMVPPPPEITYSPPPPPPSINSSLQSAQIPAQNPNNDQSMPQPSTPLPSSTVQSSSTTMAVTEAPPVPQVVINTNTDQEAPLLQNSVSQLSVQEPQNSIPPQDYSSQIGAPIAQSVQQVPNSQQEGSTDQTIQQVVVPQLDYSSQQNVPTEQNLQQIVSPQEQQQKQPEYLADQIQSTQQLIIPQQETISQQQTEQPQQTVQTTEQNNLTDGSQQQVSIVEPQQTSELSIQSNSIALPTTDQLQLSN